MNFSPFKSLLAFAFAMLPFYSFAQIQEEEPNDEYVQAQMVSPNETINASWSTPFEWDIFAFTLTEPGKISCDIVNAGLEPLSLAIVNQTQPSQTVGQLVEELNVSDPQFHIEKCCLAEGLYAIRLRAPFDADMTSYTVELTFTPYDGPNDETSHLSNQDSDNAIPIMLSEDFIVNGVNGFDTHQDGVSRDRVDWFRFEMPSRGEIFIDSLISSAEYDATCASYIVSDPSYRFLMPGTNNLGQLNTDEHYECLSAGTHYISFDGPGQPPIDEYCVSYSLFGEQVLFEDGDDGSNDFEDDTFETAREYSFSNDGPSKGYIGHIRYTGGLSSDQTDWWKVTTETSGPLTITVEFEGINLNVYFANPNGTNVPFSFSSDNSEGFRNYLFPCVEAGQEILVRITQGIGDPCGEYFLEAFSGNDNFQSDDDNNDTFETAQQIAVDVSEDVAIGHEHYDEDFDDVDDEIDYFKVTLENGQLRADFNMITGDFPEVNLFVEDLNADDEITMHRVPIGPDEIDNENLVYTWDCVASGDYFISVEPSANNTCSTMSMILYNFGELAEDQEPNEELPNVLSNNEATGALGFPKGFLENNGIIFQENDNLDAWSYEMENPGNLFVNITSQEFDNPLIFDLRVYNSEGADITNFGVFQETPDNQTEWLLTCVDDGTFTIEIDLDVLSPCGIYTISCSGEDVMAGADNDDNDSFETAQGIEVGGFEQGSLGFRDELDLEQIDFVDFYAFNWEGGNIQIGVSSAENYLPELNLFFNDNGIPRSIAPTSSEDGELPGEYLRIYTFECWGEGNYVLELNSANVNGYDCRGYGLALYEPQNNGESEIENGSPMPIPGESVEGTIGYRFFSDGIEQIDGQDIWYKAAPPSRKLGVELNLNFENAEGFSISAAASSNGENPVEPSAFSQAGGNFALEFECFENDTLYVFLNQGSSCGAYQLSIETLDEFQFENDDEPNNTSVQALEIYNGSAVEGTLRAEKVLNGQFEEVIDSQDYYSFIVTELTDSIHLTTITDDPEGFLGSQANMTLYRSTDNGLIDVSPCRFQFVVEGQGTTYDYCCIAPGEYFVSINRLNNDASCISYQFQLDINESTGVVDQHTTEDAPPINLNLGEVHQDFLGLEYDEVIDSRDVFSVDFPAGKGIRINSHSSSFGRIKITYLGDPLDDIVVLDLPFQSATDYTMNCHRPGPYRVEFIRVYNDCQVYDLQFDLLEIEDYGENNNGFAQANPLSDGEQISAAVGHKTSYNERDDIDFYSIDVPANTSVAVSLSSIPDELEVSESFTADLMFGANVLNSVSFDALAELESSPFNNATTLYLRVNNTVGCGNYSVAIDLTSSILADFTGDGSVNGADLIEFLGSFPCSQDCGPADLNGDGVINAQDLMIFLTQFQG